jgi:integrase
MTKTKRVRFTDSYIAALKVPEGRKETTVFEAGRTGLGVRVQNTGVKTFVVQKTQRDGKRFRERLGLFGDITVDEARKLRDQIAVDLANRIDLNARRAKEKAEAARPKPIALRELIEQWRAHLQRKRRASYASKAPKAVERALQLYLDQPVASLDRRAVRACFTPLGAGAARVAGISLIACLNWGEEINLIDVNPLGKFKAPEKPPSRERALSLAEARRIFAVADELPYPEGPLVRLLMLTGARREEMGALHWSEVFDLDDEERARIELSGPRTKTGASHTIPLSSAARELLLAVPRLVTGARFEKSKYVFTKQGRSSFQSWSDLKLKLDAALGEPAITDWRMLDFRRTLVSILAVKPYRIDSAVLDKLLGHAPSKLSGIARVYNRAEFEEERREALETWASALASGDVVSIRAA